MPQRANANLVISVPRTGRTWLALVSTVGALGLGAGAIFTAFPGWTRTGGLLIAAAALALIGWWLLPAGRLEFDLGRGLLLKDGRKLARIADIDCVRITEPGIGDEDAPYLVELLRGGEPLLLVGYTKDEVEASSLAARVATALGRPVTVA
jgi:hypothetical protein